MTGITDMEGQANGIRWIAERLAPERRSYLANAIAALLICGLYWWAPVVVFSDVAAWRMAMAAAICAIWFPASFMIANYYWSDRQDWKVGEIIYGTAQGVGLMLIAS